MNSRYGSDPAIYSPHGSQMPQRPSTPQVPSTPHVPRRTKTVRRAIAIRDGKLVVDLNVGTGLTNNISNKHSEGEEFQKLRYTAVTCDPDDFAASGYQLRQSLWQRPTELFIVVTMYNEDAILFTRTMTAINKNVQNMCNRKSGPFSGEYGWQRIVVCIVSDGRHKISKDVLVVLSAMGLYQEGVCVPRFMNKDTQAHLFEYTTQICVTDTMGIKTHRDFGVVPLQMLFCLKEKNMKKLNSHRWFFNAFSNVLRPNVCILIDVGTKPRSDAIFKLWRVFDADIHVGGCCGEIAVEYNSIFHLLKPIIAAQNFEYKISNILDKPLESWAGYISVLPGAFSAYRYVALKGRPLEQYFKGENLHNSGDVFAANMYLAEDRILCFELVAKRNESWSLYYEKSSQALTDVPSNFPEFISQRRRWLNGSTFALLYALGNVMQVYSSGHSFFRMVALTIEFIYMGSSFIFSYFSLANYYLAYYFLSAGFSKFTDSKEIPFGYPRNETLQNVLNSIFSILRAIYILSLCTTFISALGNRPQGARYIYLFAVWLFAIITASMLYMIIVTAIDSFKVFNTSFTITGPRWQSFIFIIMSLVTSYGVLLISSILYLDPWHMIFNFIQYLFLIPTYVNVLQIYAYCNISDVSWGTKGDTTPVALNVAVKTTEDGQATAEVELPSQHQNDVTNAYNQRLSALQTLGENMRRSKQKETATQLSSEDYFKQFRTIWLLIWIVFNGTLVSIMIEPKSVGLPETVGTTYFMALLVVTTIFSLCRFIGSCGYLLSRYACCAFRGSGKAGYGNPK